MGLRSRLPVSVGLAGATLALALTACGSVSTSPASPGAVIDREAARAQFLRDLDQSLSALSHPVDPARELVITDVRVLEDRARTTYVRGKKLGDKEGAWSFGRMMESLSNSNNASAFTLAWLRQWEADQVVNGFTAPARPSVRTAIIEPWLVASGCEPTATVCDLDFAKAPFRLTAITNRLDLRKLGSVNGGNDVNNQDVRVLDAGEGRFTYHLVNASTGRTSAMSVIFEFSQPAKDGGEVVNWAKKWHDLSKHPIGPKYNEELQQVTDMFAGRNLAKGVRPNGSWINQVRTNEATLAQAGTDPDNVPSTKLWEMREFRLVGGQLRQVTTKQEPDFSFNNSEALAQWAAQNAAAILKEEHVVPDAWLAASNPVAKASRWSIPGADEAVRQKFAINTCGGCHLAETGTDFFHVKGRLAGEAGSVSAWMTDVDVPRRVRDLQEVLSPNWSPFVDDDDDAREH